MKPNVKKSLFYTIMMLGVVLFSEGILYALCAIFPSVGSVLSNYNSPLYLQDERLGVRPNPHYPEHDSNGFRNRSVPKSADIIAIGDSQTYGISASREKAWPQQLSSISQRSVYNMALGGWGPLQYLMLTDNALGFQPNVIIQAFYAGNDIYDSFLSVYGKHQFPELRSTSPEIINQIEKLESDKKLGNKIAEVTLSMGTGNPNVAENRYALIRYMLKHSKLCNLILSAIMKISKPSLFLDDAGVSEQHWLAIKDHFKNIDGSQVYEAKGIRTVFTPRYRLCALNLEDKRLEEGLRISLQAVQIQAERMKAKGIHFIVLFIPTKEYVFKDILDREKYEYSDELRVLMTNEERMWIETRQFAKKNGIEYLDSLPTLRKYVYRGTQPYRCDNDGHPNATGYRAIAELVASELVVKKW